MTLLRDGDEHVSRSLLFPGSKYRVQVPGPHVRYPVLIVHAEEKEQQLLPVRGDRYDDRPHLAVICLSCGEQVSSGREDVDGVDQRVHDDLVNHQCGPCYIEGVAPEQYARKYRELLDSIFNSYAVVRDLRYICPCDVLYPNNFTGFAAHIPHCPVFVGRVSPETTKEAAPASPSGE